jgi:hypothetical protein
MTACKAYVAAGYKADRGAASRMSANVSIKARIAELKGKAAEGVCLTVGEGLMFLTEIITCSAAGIPVESRLVNEVTRDILTGGADGDGEGVTIREKVKIPCKLGALRELAKIRGWYAAEKQEVTHTLNEGRLAKLMGVDS